MKGGDLFFLVPRIAKKLSHANTKLYLQYFRNTPEEPDWSNRNLTESLQFMSATDVTGRFGALTPPDNNAYPATARLTGRLVALRSKAEIDASFQTIDAYVIELPEKSANSVLMCVKRVGYRRRD